MMKLIIATTTTKLPIQLLKSHAENIIAPPERRWSTWQMLVRLACLHVLYT